MLSRLLGQAKSEKKILGLPYSLSFLIIYFSFFVDFCSYGNTFIGVDGRRVVGD